MTLRLSHHTTTYAAPAASSSGLAETIRDHDTAHAANVTSAVAVPPHTGAVLKESTDSGHDAEAALLLEGAAGPSPTTEASYSSQRQGIELESQ